MKIGKRIKKIFAREYRCQDCGVKNEYVQNMVDPINEKTDGKRNIILICIACYADRVLDHEQ